MQHGAVTLRPRRLSLTNWRTISMVPATAFEPVTLLSLETTALPDWATRAFHRKLSVLERGVGFEPTAIAVSQQCSILPSLSRLSCPRQNTKTTSVCSIFSIAYSIWNDYTTLQKIACPPKFLRSKNFGRAFSTHLTSDWCQNLGGHSVHCL